jgi:hypothetical protein
MILFLARNLRSARFLARRHYGLLAGEQKRTLTRNDRDRTPAGMIASRPEHCEGLAVAGYVVLEPVDLALILAAAARVDRTPCGRPLTKDWHKEKA